MMRGMILRHIALPVALTLLVLPSVGCAGRAYVRHAQVGYAIYGINEALVPVLKDACHERATAAASNPNATLAEATADAEAALDRCGTIEQVQHRLAETHRLWSLAMAQAADDYDRFDREASQRMLFRMYDIYLEITAFLDEQFNRQLPTIPRIILRFVE